MVTVVFADLVGFTTMAETLDPEQVRLIVDSAFERLVRDVTTFGGRVDKIVGDAILALFGAPTAHEDDAERAVRAALRMQETLADFAVESDLPIRIRIGVNTGEVLGGALRAGGDYTAMGDVVNLASRLQTSADPGEVLVGESTHHLTRDLFVYESKGELVARGREQSVHAWAATEAILPPGYRPRRAFAPILGREAELSVLHNTVDVSIRHGRAQILLLLGEAGVGKTRLANEIAPIVREIEPRAVVLNGRCVPYGEANPWWPIADAVRDGIIIDLDATLDVARSKTHAAVSSVVADPATVTTVTNGLLHLLGYEGPLRGLDPARARVEATQALLAYLEAVLRHRPVVIRLADLHWADDIVLDLLDELATQLARQPLVLVATGRRALMRRWSPRAGRYNSLILNIDPLDRRAATDLLATLAGTRLPIELEETLLDRAGGNPLYLEELVSLLVDGGDVGSIRVEVPDTLRGLIAARIDALTPEEQSTLEDAAVWGSSGKLVALERIASYIRQTPDVAVVLQSLEVKEILTFDGSSWAFRSDLVREVAYSRLTKIDRLRRHHGIATYLEAGVGGRFIDDSFVDTVARHFTEAARLQSELGPVEDVPDDLTTPALRWVGEAARRAEYTAAWKLAARLYTQGLELAEDRELITTRLSFLLGRARARCELWEFDGARSDGADALALAESAGDEAARGHALLSLGEIATRSGDMDGAHRILAEAIAVFEMVGDSHARAEGLRLTGMAALFRSDFIAAKPPIEEALAAFRDSGDRRGVAWALQNLAWIAFASGRIAEAESRIEESSATFTEIGDTGGLAWALGLMAFVRFYEGRFDEAVDIATRVQRETERRGDRWGNAMMAVILASVELWSGRTHSAIELIDGSVTSFRQVGDSIGLEQALSVQARALIMVGDITAGRAAVADALRVGPGDAGLENGGMAVLADLLVKVQLGELVDDAPRLAMLDRVLAEFGDDPGMTDLAVGGALALAQLGRLDDAVRLLHEVTVDESRRANGAAWAACALVRAAMGRHDEVLEAVGRIEMLASDGAATYLDRALGAVAEGLGGRIECFELAHKLVATTGDVLDEAVVSLAEAVALRTFGDESAAASTLEAEKQWRHLGVEPTGWRQLFESAVRG